MINERNLEYVYDDGEVIYLTDGKGYYGLNYHNIDKSELRESGRKDLRLFETSI